MTRYPVDRVVHILNNFSSIDLLLLVLAKGRISFQVVDRANLIAVGDHEQPQAEPSIGRKPRPVAVSVQARNDQEIVSSQQEPKIEEEAGGKQKTGRQQEK